MSWYPRWKPYVPVARRRAKAASFAAKLAKKEGRSLSPVQIEGRKIAASFWGAAWCDHLESYSDFENRLPRGRTYVRNGSVIDLQILNGTVKALVSGSEVYHVTVEINTLGRRSWKRIKDECSESIGSLIDLLQGRFDTAIMERLIDRESGLFPQPKEIKITCSCPDWAGLCKHAAAVLYGVGARLDTAPELLFTLRGVDHLELISQATEAGNVSRALRGAGDESLGDADLGEMFGIDLDQPAAQLPPRRRGAKPEKRPAEVAASATSEPPLGANAQPGRKGCKQPTRHTAVSADPAAGAPAQSVFKRTTPSTGKAKTNATVVKLSGVRKQKTRKRKPNRHSAADPAAVR